MTNEKPTFLSRAYFKTKEAAERAFEELAIGNGVDRLRIAVEFKCESGLAPSDGDKASGSPPKGAFGNRFFSGAILPNRPHNGGRPIGITARAVESWCV